MEVKLELNESVSSPKYLTQSQGLAQKVKVELYRKPTKFGPRVQYEDHLLTERADMHEF
jgi:hypothetical protein